MTTQQTLFDQDSTDNSSQTVHEMIAEYVAHLNTYPASVKQSTYDVGGHAYSSRHQFVADKPGQKYTRIVTFRQHREDSPNWVDDNYGRSVHCFVENATGDVYKSAGWKAPAKGARFHLANDFSRADLYARSTFSGGEFYL